MFTSHPKHLLFSLKVKIIIFFSLKIRIILLFNKKTQAKWPLNGNKSGYLVQNGEFCFIELKIIVFYTVHLYAKFRHGNGAVLLVNISSSFKIIYIKHKLDL